MKEKTLYQSIQDCNEACNKLALEICYALKVDKVLDWLTKILNRINEYEQKKR